MTQPRTARRRRQRIVLRPDAPLLKFVHLVYDDFTQNDRWFLFYARVLCKADHVKRFIEQYPYSKP